MQEKQFALKEYLNGKEFVETYGICQNASGREKD